MTKAPSTADYERSIKEGGNAKEKDDEGNKAAQSGPVKRDVRKGK